MKGVHVNNRHIAGYALAALIGAATGVAVGYLTNQAGAGSGGGSSFSNYLYAWSACERCYETHWWGIAGAIFGLAIELKKKLLSAWRSNFDHLTNKPVSFFDDVPYPGKGFGNARRREIVRRHLALERVLHDVQVRNGGGSVTVWNAVGLS